MTTTPNRDDIHAACMKVLDAFMDGLNAHDADAMDRAMHFPHVRFAGGTIKIYEAPGSNPMDLFARLKAEDGWNHSVWRKRELVQFNDSKAHVTLSYTRFRGDGSEIGTYESLYILTRIGESWGIRIRSSFGP
jgi:hypothetical protein